MIRFYSNVLLLQSYLKTNNIPYLFWNACSNVPSAFTAYYQEVDTLRFPFILEKEYSFTNLLVAKNFQHSEFAEFGHYGEDAQIWFAEFLQRYLTKEKLL